MEFPNPIFLFTCGTSQNSVENYMQHYSMCVNKTMYCPFEKTNGLLLAKPSAFPCSQYEPFYRHFLLCDLPQPPDSQVAQYKKAYLENEY